MEADAAIATVTAWLDRTGIEVARARAEDTAHEYHGVPASALSPAPAFATWRTALHEAAHAVAAVIQGARLRRVVLRSGFSAAEIEESSVAARAITQLAAPVLELLAGASARRQCELACSYDISAARCALSDAPEVTHRTAATMAAAIVVSKLSAIERVAACLAAVGELSGHEVAALCGATP